MAAAVCVQEKFEKQGMNEAKPIFFLSEEMKLYYPMK